MFISVNVVSEHDDRDRDNIPRPSDMTIRKSNKNDNRRVSFKNANVGTSNASSIQQKLRKKYVVQGLRSQLEEDDERMVDFDPHKTSTFRRRNSPIPGSARNNRAKGLVENGAGWYQVTVSVDFAPKPSHTKLSNRRKKCSFVHFRFFLVLCSFHMGKSTIKI